MKPRLFIVFILLMFDTVNSSNECNESACLICRNIRCNCGKYGCGDNCKMSLKKLILHAVKIDEKENSERDTYRPIVRFLKDVLKRSSSHHNTNEESSIRDMILTRLKILRCKCPCIEQPHETLLRRFLELLLEKCSQCECGLCECECTREMRTCDPTGGTHWFKTTDETVEKERRKNRRGDGETCVKPNQAQFDRNYGCPRFIADEASCSEFSICTDCDNRRMFVVKNNGDIWLICDGCKVNNSPYVQFTKGGCPVKFAAAGDKKRVNIKTKYLQLNDFREKDVERGRSVFECPSKPRPSKCRRLKASKASYS